VHGCTLSIIGGTDLTTNPLPTEQQVNYKYARQSYLPGLILNFSPADWPALRPADGVYTLVMQVDEASGCGCAASCSWTNGTGNQSLPTPHREDEGRPLHTPLKIEYFNHPARA
jgi:hypothetical protein